MAHYALINDDDVVINVIVGRDEDDLPEGITDWEDHYSEVTGYTCKRTSYNTYRGQHLDGGVPFRMNYAEIGGTYDATADAFIPRKPFPSWTLDTSTYTWEPPIALPDMTSPEWSPEVLADHNMTGLIDADHDDPTNFLGFWDEVNRTWAPPGVYIPTPGGIGEPYSHLTV